VTVPALTDAALAFVVERHLASLTTLRPDGTPHVIPVGFTFDPDTGTAWVISGGGSRKVANARGQGRAALCQVDGARWLTLEGTVRVHDEPAVVADAVRRYAVRYREPRVNPERVALEITVDRILGSGAVR
jgi:PPOX class probable F420-dependent enzyme